MGKAIPSTFRDPMGLAQRLLRSGDRTAYSAMFVAGLAALATPLDALLAARERSLYRRGASPHKPIVLVAGAPRSGTTIVSQVLVRNLPVIYFNNLTQVFPRSPIVANRLFGRLLREPERSFRNFYGRTRRLSGRNDALHIWDRWWGPDRYHPPQAIPLPLAEDMRAFFAAYESAFGRPIVNKNNALATCAKVIADALPTARFLLIERNAATNVQSILRAREMIQGDRRAPYGVPAPPDWDAQTPIEEVCAQVVYHQRIAREQQAELGSDRVWIVRYEDFCSDPAAVVERVGREILDVTVDRASLTSTVPQLQARTRLTLPRTDLEAIERGLALYEDRRTARLDGGAAATRQRA